MYESSELAPTGLQDAGIDRRSKSVRKPTASGTADHDDETQQEASGAFWKLGCIVF